MQTTTLDNEAIPGTALMMRIRGLLADQLRHVAADDPERSRLVAIIAITASPDQERR